MTYFDAPYRPADLTVDSSHSLATGMQLWFPFTTGTGISAQCILHASHTGTLQSGASWASSDIGTVLELDGNSEVDFTTDISRNKTAVSCSAWIKPDIVSGNHFVFYEENSVQSFKTRFGLIIVGGAVRCGGRDDDGDNFTVFADSNTNIVATGVWQHVVAVFDPTGGGCKVYLDGVDVTASSDNTGDGFPDTASLNQVIGGIGSNSSFMFDGQIQNLRVWDRAISQQEVTLLHARPWTASNYDTEALWLSPPASPTLSSASEATALMSSCVGWWPLVKGSGTVAADLVGSNNGTLSGGVSWASSEIGTVASFDGSNDYIEFSHSAELSFDVAAGATFSAWVKPDDLSGGTTFGTTNPRNIITKYAANVGTANYFFRLLGGSINFGYRNSANTSYVEQRSDSEVITVDSWNHVAAVHTGTAIDLYLNGVEVASTNTSGTVTDSSNTNSDSVIFGRNGNANNRYFDGNISNVRIFDAALTADQIRLLYERLWIGAEYNETAPLYPPVPSSLTPLDSGNSILTDLEGWWPLTETDDFASGAADISGNSNNGTPQSNAGSSNTALGQVLEQPDANSYISVGDVSALKITGALSISIWLKTDSSTPVNIVSKYHATSGGRAYSLHLNRPELEFNINGTTVAQGTTQIRGDDKWHHLVGVYDPSNFIRVYVDGVLDGEVTTGVPSSITDTSYPFNIGRAWNGGNVVGFLQNCRVWSRALSATEVADIYYSPWLGSAYTGTSSDPATNRFFSPAAFARLG